MDIHWVKSYPIMTHFCGLAVTEPLWLLYFAPLCFSLALILFWWPHHENRDALSTLLYACYSLHLSPPHKQPLSRTHTPTGRETRDAYPSADPTGNADTGLPICYCSLRQGREGKKIGGQRKREGAF